MKNLKKFSICLLAAIMAAACYKDKGNYDYSPISDIVIEGIDDNYTVVIPLDNKLEITPTIITSYPETDLEYTWIRYNGSRGDTISRTRNLVHPITENLGGHSFFLYVKNRTNGFFVHRRTTMTVRSEFNIGFYMLKETADGNTDIDLLLEDGRLGEDILTRTQGAPLQGKPRSLGIMYNRQMIDTATHAVSRAHSIGIVTYDKKVNILRASDMYLAFDHTNLFYGEQPDDTPYKLIECAQANLYLTNKGIYPITNTSNGSGFLGFPSGTVTGSDHYAWSPMSRGLTCWDAQTKGLVFINTTAVTSRLNDATYGDFSALDCECVALGSNGKDDVYALLKSNATGLITLYSFTVSASAQPPACTKATAIPETSGLYRTSMIAFNEREQGAGMLYARALIYFVVDNKLYYYDIEQGTESELTPQDLPTDETITYIRNNHYHMGNPGLSPASFSYFAVATHKEGHYNLYMYNTISGITMGNAVLTASGTGRIKEVYYINTAFNHLSYNTLGTSTNNYNYTR